MSNLQNELTHSILFLSNITKDINTVYNQSKSIVDILNDIDLKNSGSSNEMRTKSTKTREDLDELIELINDDYSLFQKDISNIKKNKNDEIVIYSLRRYKEYYHKIKNEHKKIKKLYKKIEIDKDRCQIEKDYIRFIAINKSTVPLYRVIQILDGILYGLSVLLDIEEKEEE